MVLLSLLWFAFDPWPRNLGMPKKKKSWRRETKFIAVSKKSKTQEMHKIGEVSVQSEKCKTVQFAKLFWIYVSVAKL